MNLPARSRCAGDGASTGVPPIPHPSLLISQAPGVIRSRCSAATRRRSYYPLTGGSRRTVATPPPRSNPRSPRPSNLSPVPRSPSSTPTIYPFFFSTLAVRLMMGITHVHHTMHDTQGPRSLYIIPQRRAVSSPHDAPRKEKENMPVSLDLVIGLSSSAFRQTTISTVVLCGSFLRQGLIPALTASHLHLCNHTAVHNYPCARTPGDVLHNTDPRL